MKPTKVAAVVAGSVMALGAATPAMAADNLAPTSLTGGVETLTSQLSTHQVESALTDGGTVDQVKQAASALNSVNDTLPLLGGLPLAK
jgi:hypothetical protein